MHREMRKLGAPESAWGPARLSRRDAILERELVSLALTSQLCVLWEMLLGTSLQQLAFMKFLMKRRR